jgi:subtilisin family serine protease
VSIADASSLNIKQVGNGLISVSNKNDKTETAIYSKYKVFTFKTAYPNTDRDLFKTVYHIATNNEELFSELQKNYPKKYSRIFEIFPTPGAFFPNDYGNTSPVENLANNYSSRDLDLINAAGAWGITKGDKKVIIGISDSPIDSLNSDLDGKIIKNLYVYPAGRLASCYHGTNVASIAFARIDNGYGRPGICGECRGISGRYGTFKSIEDLVDAGAKVINASWILCSMGPRSEEMNKRISEYYDDGIIIVAAAGNGADCNRDKSTIGDKMYPASFDKVISVSGIFAENQFVEDGYFFQDNINYTHRLSDRRNGFFIINEVGMLNPTPIEDGVQVNTSVDLVAPREGYLLGNEICGKEVFFGGATSSSAPYVAGTIGLMWSANYCLSSYEIESLLKLASADVENLSGNTPFRGMMGAGRLDVYKAVKMANDMKDLKGNVLISNRDFYRFDFKIERALNTITIENQTFRENASVDFKARKAIILKPNTRLKPNDSTKIRLSIDPNISTVECEPQPPKKYDRLYK